MSCPECGAESSRVVITRSPVNDPAARCRRRECSACGHRYYTLQPPEMVVSRFELEWLGSDVRINPAALRRSRGPAD
jgi:transcriptional regulator NrdR family protein